MSKELLGYKFYNGDGFDTPYVSTTLGDDAEYYARGEVDELVSALRARHTALVEAVKTLKATLGNCEVSSNAPAIKTCLAARAEVDRLIADCKGEG
jgi:hypothetical protein